MQVGYKVEECNHTDCSYRTEPITNADRIRSMTDEELNYFLHKVTYGMDECQYEYGSEKRSNGSSSRKENDYEQRLSVCLLE